MKKFLRFSLGALIGTVCAYLTAVIGLRIWLATTYPRVNFSIVPTKVSNAYTRPVKANDWSVKEFKNLTFSVPSSWQNLYHSDKTTVWGNEAVQVAFREPGRVNSSRYRRSMYGTWHALGLFDRGVLFPPVDPHSVKIIEQRIGVWQAFLFITPEKWWCDLFQGDIYTSLSVMLKTPNAANEQLLKDVIATIEIKMLSSPGRG